MKLNQLLFACIAIVLFFTSCKQKSKLPNIVLVMADDMGYECLGCNGSVIYNTPNLDRLALKGIRFEHCYSQPLCTPSRVKIMTGQYNFRNYEHFGYLNPNQKTFANVLKDAGYTTCIAGKWQLNGLNRNNQSNQDVSRPYHFGFDEYCLWQLNHPRKDGERFANPMITQNGKDLPRDENKYGPDIFCEFVSDFIDRKAEQPFFVYYPMVLVHDPFVPTPDSPEWQDKLRRYEHNTRYFKDMMVYTDKIVGKLENKLKEKQVWENTIFIFTADNGTHPSVYSETVHGIVRGGKGYTYLTGNHVPMIAVWPAKMNDGKVFKGLVSFTDFLPTFAEVAGVDPQTIKNDGKSLLSVLSGTENKNHDNVLIHYTPRWGNKKHDRWVMGDTYKLYQDGRFYNMLTDTLEKTPLNELSKEEETLKTIYQEKLKKAEKEFPFSWNDKAYKPQK